MTRFSRVGATFSAAAAVAAAAAMDPIVERLSNAGVFGSGRFTDHSNIDVIPAFCVAFALCALVTILLARRMLASRAYAPHWLRRCSAEVHSGPVIRLVPAIFAAQLAVLYFMETIEQIAVTGHVLSGAVWLGGPLFIALAMHFVACLASTWLLSRTLHWAARSIALIVKRALEVLQSFAEPAPVVRNRFGERLKCTEPYLAVPCGRAPPFLSAANP